MRIGRLIIKKETIQNVDLAEGLIHCLMRLMKEDRHKGGGTERK